MRLCASRDQSAVSASRGPNETPLYRTACHCQVCMPLLLAVFAFLRFAYIFIGGGAPARTRSWGTLRCTLVWHVAARGRDQSQRLWQSSNILTENSELTDETF